MTSEAVYQQRFWSRVSGGDVETCWVWTRGKTRAGYGHFYYLNGSVPAHRFSYRTMVGEIPNGLCLDHLCRNHACVNPWHLEPVTQKVNVQRGEGGQHMKAKLSAESCGKGHPWAENEYVMPSGRRQCRACSREREARRTRRTEVAARRAARAGMTCQLADCHEPLSSKGWCKMHAERVRRNGHPYLQSEVAA